MHARPYTAVLIHEHSFMTRVANLAAPLNGTEAKASVESSNPGFKLVALIPGHHAVSSHGFELDYALRGTADRFLDPFDHGTIP
jgi:hypothetical protein